GEEVPDPGRPCAVIGRCAEGRHEDPCTPALASRIRVGSVTQTLERLREAGLLEPPDLNGRAEDRSRGSGPRLDRYAVVPEQREGRNAGQLDAAGRDGLPATLRDSGDLVLQCTGGERRGDAALGLDALEQLPGLAGEVVRQLLDV